MNSGIKKCCEICNKELIKQQKRFCSYFCRDMAHKKYKHSEETKRKISKGNTGKIFTEERKQKISNAKKGKTFTEEHKRKLSKIKKGKESPRKGAKLSKETIAKMRKSLKGRKTWVKGKTFTEEHKRKLRQSAIKRIEKNNGKVSPNFNWKACEYFKQFDKNNNTKGFYGENEYYIKELGYWPDYINFNTKLIIEWDEENHYIGDNLKEKDLQRQKEIQGHFPDFEFKRIRERDESDKWNKEMQTG